MCTAHAIDNCAHQIKRSCVPFLIREGRISWWAVLWNTDKISQHYQIDECRNPGHYIKASGIEIVHENANFCGSETDFPQREKNCPWGKEIGGTKKEEKKKEAAVLVPHQIPAKHTERVHMHHGYIIFSTVTCCYSHGLATGLNAVILTHFCATFRLRKSKCYESFEG